MQNDVVIFFAMVVSDSFTKINLEAQFTEQLKRYKI